MHKNYIDSLICGLQSVQVYDQSGNLIKDFEEALQKITGLFLETRSRRNQVFFTGNGGSAAIASHMTADFMKNGGMRTRSLYDLSLLTCMGNDYGYECIFSQPLEDLANKGDLLVAVSSSGNSPNIVQAVDAAQRKGMKIITFTGFEKENRIRSKGTYNIYVPVTHYGITESVHNLLLQEIVDEIKERDKKARQE